MHALSYTHKAAWHYCMHTVGVLGGGHASCWEGWGPAACSVFEWHTHNFCIQSVHFWHSVFFLVGPHLCNCQVTIAHIVRYTCQWRGSQRLDNLDLPDMQVCHQAGPPQYMAYWLHQSKGKLNWELCWLVLLPETEAGAGTLHHWQMLQIHQHSQASIWSS